MRFRRRVRGVGPLLIIASLGWLGIGQGHAYDEDGHFYTAAALQFQRRPRPLGSSRDQAVLMAFCAQLPDLANDFDTATLRITLGGWWAPVQNVTWGSFSQCWGSDVQHMVTVHHYLHGLTSTKAEPVTNAAMDTLRSL